MRVASPLPHKKARIEIIPLIDIMFFLLASFMMVSLSQVHMKGIRVNLPSSIAVAQPTPPQTKRITPAFSSMPTDWFISTSRSCRMKT